MVVFQPEDKVLVSSKHAGKDFKGQWMRTF